MRVVTWNCQRARASSKVWELLTELSPDIALLQEVGSLPAALTQKYAYIIERAVKPNGELQRFSNAVLVKGALTANGPLTAAPDWVSTELKRFEGNIVSCLAKPVNGPPLNVVCVYNPARPIDGSRFIGVDTSPVKLKLDPDVWVGDILWYGLRHQRLTADDLWLVGGDFNLSESFDWRPKGPRGNKEYLDRMAHLGLVECLRQITGCVTPTFRNTDGRAIKHQLDHLFVTKRLALSLKTCCTGSQELVFGGLSDHLPVIADFDLASLCNTPNI